MIMVLILATVTLSCAAQMTASYDSVEELLLLMRIDETLTRTFAQMRPTFLRQFQQLAGEELTPEQVQITEKYLEKLFDLMEEELSWEKLKDDYIRIYSAVYTEEEIRELIEFYRSPVGQKTVEQMPVLMEESMAISQKYLLNLMPRIQELTAEMQAELEENISQ